MSKRRTTPRRVSTASTVFATPQPADWISTCRWGGADRDGKAAKPLICVASVRGRATLPCRAKNALNPNARTAVPSTIKVVTPK